MRRDVREYKKTVIWFVWFVLFVWLNQINQRDQINQMNRSMSDRRKVANNDLGNFLKIVVRCQDREPVLHGAGGNPDIVGGNWGAGLLQGNADGCVSVRRLFVHDKHADARGFQKNL